MTLDRAELEKVLEALKGAYAEIDGMMYTYEEYAPSGRLCDQIEEAIAYLDEVLG